LKDVEKYEKDGTMPERKRKREGKGKEIINDDEKEVDVSTFFLINSELLYLYVMINMFQDVILKSLGHNS